MPTYDNKWWKSPVPADFTPYITKPTNNWQEEFDIKFSDKLDFQKSCTQDLHPTYPVIYTYELEAFIETQISLARKEMKNKLIEYVDKELKLVGYEHKEILQFISSL